MCIAWLCGVWLAVVDIVLEELGWLNSSSTWFGFQSNKPHRQLAEKVNITVQDDVDGRS